jgi:hypothetical protein
MFFSASSSAKLRLEAKTRTSAMERRRWRKERETSRGIPWVGSSTSTSLFGLVADARRGRRPPQAMIRLSVSWEMRWTVLTTNIALSAALTKSRTDLVECVLQT